MIVIVDGNGLLWRAAHSVGEQRVATGILDYLNEIVEKFSPESLIVCWDSGVSRYRSRIYPAYKAQRKPHKDKFDMHEIMRHVDALRSYLTHKGIQQVRIPGVEADDAISWLSEYIAYYVDKPVAIISADRDLWQLVTDKISVYDIMRSIKATPELVQKTFGVSPYLVPQYKAIVGDSSDNIKGIKGLGEARAKALFSEYDSVEEMFKPENVKALSKSAITARLYGNEDDYHRDLALTTIPKLRDLPWYVNEEEREALRNCLNEYPKVNEKKAQGIADMLGKSLVVYRKMQQVDFSRMPLELQQSGVYTDWSMLDKAILSCNRCSLRTHCGSYGPTLAEGYSDVDIMLVGRNPGKTELEGGKPFIGESGKLVDEFLEKCGLTRRDVYITNVCKCHSENNRALTVGEVGACSEYLQAEVDLLKPKLIVTFGNEAMSQFTEYQQGVSSHSGEIVLPGRPNIKHSAWVAICVHPSAALRSSKGRTNFDYAVKMVARFMEKKRG